MAIDQGVRAKKETKADAQSVIDLAHKQGLKIVDLKFIDFGHMKRDIETLRQRPRNAPCERRRIPSCEIRELDAAQMKSA